MFFSGLEIASDIPSHESPSSGKWSNIPEIFYSFTDLCSFQAWILHRTFLLMILRVLVSDLSHFSYYVALLTYILSRLWKCICYWARCSSRTRALLWTWCYHPPSDGLSFSDVLLLPKWQWPGASLRPLDARLHGSKQPSSIHSRV